MMPGNTATGVGRLGWVDIAKAICILLVVAMHSTLGVEKAAGGTGWMGGLVAFAQPFRIPAFFALSGLFLGRVIDRDRRTFFDRRVLHFAYFYGLWLTIQFVFKAPGMIAETGLAETARAYLAALLVEPFGTLWFIWMLPVFALVVRATRRVPWPAMLGLAALLETAPIATGHLVIDEFAARFVYFYAGYALSAPLIATVRRAAAAPAAALAALSAWGLVSGWLVFAGMAALPVVSLLLGAFGTLAILAAAALLAGVPRIAAPLRFLGEKSIVIYLAFFLPMAAMRAVLLETGLVPDIGTMSLITTLFAVFVPLALWWISKRAGVTFPFERPRWARLDAGAGQAVRRRPEAAEQV